MGYYHDCSYQTNEKIHYWQPHELPATSVLKSLEYLSRVSRVSLSPQLSLTAAIDETEPSDGGGELKYLPNIVSVMAKVQADKPKTFEPTSTEPPAQDLKL